MSTMCPLCVSTGDGARCHAVLGALRAIHPRHQVPYLELQPRGMLIGAPELLCTYRMPSPNIASKPNIKFTRPITGESWCLINA